MKRIIFIFFISITSSSIFIFAQVPEVMFPIQVYDNGTVPGGINLEFGVDQTGTDSLDLSLGEVELPPSPPAGVFFARFILPPGNFSGMLSSYRDIRNSTGYPYTGSHEYRIKYQVSEGSTHIVIKWNLSTQITGLMQDIIGGIVINKPMAGTDSLVITNFALNELKMFIDYDAVVPVELSFFSAIVFNNKVTLEWRTESEINNSGFEIERRTSFSEWQKIDFVPGHGTTTEPNNYRYSDDDQLMFRTYLYRLKQIDFDGTFSYSNEIQIELFSPTKFHLSQNYPNPFNPSTTISFSIPYSALVTLVIYNTIGEKVDELVSQVLDEGTYNYIWNATGFTSGVYIYQLSVNQFSSIRKMQLIK